MRVKRHLRLIMATALTALSLTACGSGGDLPSDVSSSLDSAVDTSSSSSSASNDELAAAIPKILAGLEDIKQEIKALEIRSTSGATVGTGTTKPSTSTTKPSTSTTKPTTGASKPATGTTKPSTGAAKPDEAAKPSAKEQGETEFRAILKKVQSAQFVSLTAEKHEKNLNTGKVSYNKIQMYSKLPNTVKINIVKSSSGSEGVQALYTSGVGSKITVKKLFIKLDLPKNDEKVASNNGYLADDIDLFGISKRWSSGYEAELIGTTQLAGKTINILKLTTSGENTLDKRITHEYLGYESGTYAIRLWECYNEATAKDPYNRMIISDITFPASLPANALTLN